MGAAQNANAWMYVIADGTSKPGSGELAQSLTEYLVDAFSRADPSHIASIDAAVETTHVFLNQARREICPKYPLASASYLVLLVVDAMAASIHEGDCCLGFLSQEQSLEWLSDPHCVANWRGGLAHDLIAASSARKNLFKCMSHRRPHEPSVQSIPITPDAIWILATDGFWAELSKTNQMVAIEEGCLQEHVCDDDVTFMVLMS